MKLCWIHRTLAGCWPDSSLAARLTVRHARGCPRCRTHLSAIRSLEEWLVPPAGAPPLTTPPSLKHQILIRLEAPPPAPVRVTSRPLQRWALPAAAAAACVVLVTLSLRNRPLGKQPGDPLSVASDLAPAVRQVARGTSLPALATAAGQPLTTELTNTLHGGHVLLAGMIQSVLPDAAADAVLDHAGLSFGER